MSDSTCRMPAHWHNYIWQPLLAAVFICMVLVCFNFISVTSVLWAVGAGALSSSAFIVFGLPSSVTAKAGKIIGGYAVGIICGLIVRLSLQYFLALGVFHTNMPHFHLLGMFAAITVGISLFFMGLLKVEHPPAAGMSLVLVIDIQNYSVLAVIFAAAILLAVLHQALKKYLCDLTV
ncbi:MAG: HPP family protein [Gammaproteobacteria bacterium]|nr:HPP family protein [Gammaproteobacteria bacterium]